ncbi:MAG: VOC family protein [Oscillospiraceae bacterium]|nr:VOC family protein [Oscillospiraceae bacterium]
MSKRIFRPLHCAISVTNLEEAIQWFADILDFQLLSKSEFTPMGFRAAFLSNGADFEMELFEHQNPIPLPPERRFPNDDLQTCGTKHVAFQVDDLDAVLAEFLGKGVEVVMGPRMAFDMYVAFIHGPDDVLIEFIQR